MIAGGGVAAAAAYTGAILTDELDLGLAVTALGGLTTAVGLVIAGLALRLALRVAVAWISSALLFGLSALTLVGYIGFFLAPVALALVAAVAMAASRATSIGGWFLLASLAVYGVAAAVLEGLNEDGAYGVVAFGPVFAAAWLALAAGVVMLVRRPA